MSNAPVATPARVAEGLGGRQRDGGGVVPRDAEFLFTTPGLVVTHYDGLPVLGAQPGQFLLKDLVLIGVALWTLGEALGAPAKYAAKTADLMEA